MELNQLKTLIKETFILPKYELEIKSDNDTEFWCHVKTNQYQYSINASVSTVNEVNHYYYLGCVGYNRYPLPGEKHLRGNDLSDGKLSFGTWNNILEDINRWEEEDNEEL